MTVGQNFLPLAVAELQRHLFVLGASLIATHARHSGSLDLPLSFRALTDEQSPTLIANESLLVAAAVRRAIDTKDHADSLKPRIQRIRDGVVGVLRVNGTPPLQLTFREAANKLLHAAKVHFVCDVAPRLLSASEETRAEECEQVESRLGLMETSGGASDLADVTRMTDEVMSETCKYRGVFLEKFASCIELESFGHGLGGLELTGYAGHHESDQWSAIIHMGAFLSQADQFVEQFKQSS